MGDTNYSEKDEQAAFNMAVDTLRRLGEMLREIKMISINHILDKGAKQEIKIILIKNFFVQASPLLEEEQREKFKEKIIKLNPKINMVGEKGSYGNKINYYLEKGFDPQLEMDLDNILIDLQCELQKKGHFMPSSEEGGWD